MIKCCIGIGLSIIASVILLIVLNQRKNSEANGDKMQGDQPQVSSVSTKPDDSFYGRRRSIDFSYCRNSSLFTHVVTSDLLSCAIKSDKVDLATFRSCLQKVYPKNGTSDVTFDSVRTDWCDDIWQAASAAGNNSSIMIMTSAVLISHYNHPLDRLESCFFSTQGIRNPCMGQYLIPAPNLLSNSTQGVPSPSIPLSPYIIKKDDIKKCRKIRVKELECMERVLSLPSPTRKRGDDDDTIKITGIKIKPNIPIKKIKKAAKKAVKEG